MDAKGQILCSIDPGKRACGVAFWRVVGGKGRLIWCGLVRRGDGNPALLAKKILDLRQKADVYYVEDPQLYPHHRNPHLDLRSLKSVLAAVERLSEKPMVRLKPNRWKGNIPKKIHHRRIKACLDSAEKEMVPEDHNVLDAVALGLYATGRTRKGKL